MRRFSQEEKNLLTPFFSNLHRPVFALVNMPEVLKGALLSRYSRSTKNLRELFLDEYLKSEELAILKKTQETYKITQFQNLLNTDRAKEFYRKWLAMYGDDSIAELGGIHLGVEGISVVATKTIEDRRIGLSPLEKSTRYVRFDNKVNGKYLYYRDKDILQSRYGRLYLATMDQLFETYSRLINPLVEFFQKKYPKAPEVSDRAYATSIRSKACDSARGLLPMGTLTNMGLFGNGRAFEYLLTKMYAHDLPEVRQMAKVIHVELSPIIGSFLERLGGEKGEAYIQYLENTQKSVTDLAHQKFSQVITAGSPSVTLVQKEDDTVVRAAAAVLYPDCKMPWTKLLAAVRKLPERKLSQIIETYVNKRQGRWHKVGKSFEEIYYSFEIVSDLGVYKDLQRHRILTNFRQLFTTENGFEIPNEITEAGLDRDFTRALHQSDKAYRRISRHFPAQAQYLSCHGHLGRWKIKLNLREAFHLCELRSSPQGHPGYRKVAQDIYKRIKEADPILGNSMRFVNFTEPGLERLSAEVRKEEKLKLRDLKPVR